MMEETRWLQDMKNNQLRKEDDVTRTTQEDIPTWTFTKGKHKDSTKYKGKSLKKDRGINKEENGQIFKKLFDEERKAIQEEKCEEDEAFYHARSENKQLFEEYDFRDLNEMDTEQSKREAAYKLSRQIGCEKPNSKKL